MGIKHFFRWFKEKFPTTIENLKSNQSPGCEIDNLLLDLNGIFHYSAQKIYEYGNFAHLPGLLRKKYDKTFDPKKQDKVFKDICDIIEKLKNVIKPKKRLILAVDGPAPVSKQNQQRQRRFKTAKESKYCPFDSNAISPGTKFMDFLSKYIDWFLKKKITEDKDWQNIEIIFSNEKVPGEGEHKLISYIRTHGSKQESYCVYSADADLIMLSLATHYPKFYLLRDEQYTENVMYNMVDIGITRKELISYMNWGSNNDDMYINDFILLCFMVGNDFLPNVPSIEIIEGGIETMIEIYKKICSRKERHLVKNSNDQYVFSKKILKRIFVEIGKKEKHMLENKLSHKEEFIRDPMLEKYYANNELNLDSYISEYYQMKFTGVNRETIVQNYLEGLHWVFQYYLKGVPCWRWRYPHHYAPFASTIGEYASKFKIPTYEKTVPTPPYVQLLSILPSKSAHLLPESLRFLLMDDSSQLAPFTPKDFNIDCCGKRKEWEGIPILPMIDYKVVENVFAENRKNLGELDYKRNIHGKSYTYIHDANVSRRVKSYYGEYDCSVRTEIVYL